MSVAIVIPARLASMRLPRKLLLDLGGKSVLQRTWEQALKATRADRVLIATDSRELADAAVRFGAAFVMTRSDHQSGTERLAEAALEIDAEIFVNVQGDEPEIDPAHIDALIEAHGLAESFATTLACPFPADLDPENPAAVKAIPGEAIDRDRRIFSARNFSRTPLSGDARLLHIGAYAYDRESLMRFVAAPRGGRERLESLEQLRILEMGERIAIRIVESAHRGIDTTADYEAARARFAGKK